MKIPLHKKFIAPSLGLAAVVVLVATAVFFRVVVLGDKPVATFMEILLWQGASWLPWVLVIGLLTLPFGAKARTAIRQWNPAAHVVAAVVVATTSTLWFKLISENISPFLGMEETRYGVFPWFFIFWFFFGLFMYWGGISFFGLIGQQAPSNNKKSEALLVVKTGKVSEVIKPKDVLWIEAQDYYSVLHLEGRQSWIKMTMKELEKTLDSTSFVRVHRSTIINVDHLKQIKTETTGKYSAIMNDGKKRPISRQGWRDLKKVLKSEPH
ncbi:MAG: LytTR family DNA-binding domain-containing protein [Sphingomonadales bacterium]